MEVDADLVGDDADVRPLAFADGIVAALDREGAIEAGAPAVDLVGDGSADGVGLALDGELAIELQAPLAEWLDAARFEACEREGGGVEPVLPLTSSLASADPASMLASFSSALPCPARAWQDRRPVRR